MSLDLSRLANVHQRGNRTIARCPACAEQDHDAKGKHLVIMPDGKFGCVTCPGAAGKSHRQRIYALAGDVCTRRRGSCLIRVRRPVHSTSVKPASCVVDLGRLGRVMSTPAPCVDHAAVGGYDQRLPKIAGDSDIPGRFGRVSDTYALRVNESINDDGGNVKENTYTHSVGRNPSEASGVSGGPATCRNDGQADIAIQDTDPQTGCPIIDGAHSSHPSQFISQQRRQAPPPECGDPFMATALATFNGPRQVTPATQDTDPETGHPIIGGAICPF